MDSSRTGWVEWFALDGVPVPSHHLWAVRLAERAILCTIGSEKIAPLTEVFGDLSLKGWAGRLFS
ncbi:MAG: hypothetical protein ISN29_00855 [Gammaproteobacteria bacterium AqS3]|nr:hypothetical protein [Gammaproteobacteria bacterium AqS3]